MFAPSQNSISRFFSRIPRELLENAWSIMVAILFLLIWLLMNSCGNKPVLVQPEQKPLMEAVYASGFVRAQQEYEVFAEGEGYVVDKLVNDGDSVRRGDALYVLSSTQSGARYQIAKQNYELAAKNLDENSALLSELNSMVQSAQSKMWFDSTNYVRYKNLLQQNVGTRVEFDRMKLAYENSANEYKLYKSRYEKTLGDLQVVRNNAQQQLVIASDDSGKNVVKSLLDGKVFFTRKEKGELVRRGESLAMIGSTASFHIELSVDELDINKLQIGQWVLVKADAFPDKVFHASVSKIYPLVDTRQQSLRVDAILTESIPGNFSGLALEANIVIQQKEKALIIPKAALIEGDSVWVEQDGEVVKRAVKKGIVTLDEVEIVSGIDSATNIVIK